MARTRIIVGCGYLGHRIGRLWCDAGDGTIGVTRTKARAAELQMAGIRAAQADVTKAESLSILSQFCEASLERPEAVVYSVGHDRSAGANIFATFAKGLQNVLSSLPPCVDRAIHISTTGVYGSAGGAWVDERTPPHPQREGGAAALAAEQALAAHPIGRRSAILRLAGLYGPGRVPHLDKLCSGEPIPVPRDGWLNLIHVADAARIVVAADAWLVNRARGDGPHVFCVCDGSPVRREEYYREAAHVLGGPEPRFDAPSPAAQVVARAAASRRICGNRMRDAFGIALAYPSYREGLAACLTARPEEAS